MTRPLLADAFAHHVWATLRLIDACAALDPAQLETTAPGTYGPILDTIRHIVGADRGYLFSLTGGRIGEIEEDGLDLRRSARSWPETTPSGRRSSRATSIRRRTSSAVATTGRTATLPPGSATPRPSTTGPTIAARSAPALTSLGVTPPEIDVWDWADSQGRLSVTGTAATS